MSLKSRVQSFHVYGKLNKSVKFLLHLKVLRSSSQLLLQPYNATKTKKTLGDRAFQVASPGLWNGLPNDIRNAKTMDVFKSLVKTHLFRKAYACYFF